MKYSGSIIFAFLACVSLASAARIENGGFERLNPDGTLAGWSFTTKDSERAVSQVSMSTVRSEDAPAGSRCVRIVNPASYINDVYGSLFQYPKLVPGKRYRLGFYMKGERVSMMLLILGKDWQQRWNVPTGSLKPDRWQYFYHDFTAEPRYADKDGRYMVRFNFEGLAKEAFIDGVTLVPLEGELRPAGKNARRGAELRRLPGTEMLGTFLAELTVCGMELPSGWALDADFTGTDHVLHRNSVSGLRRTGKNDEFKLNLAVPLNVPPGEFSVRLKANGKEIALSRSRFVKLESPAVAETADQKERLRKARLRFEKLNSELQGFGGSAWLSLYQNVIPCQLRLQEKDLERKYKSDQEREYYIGRGRIAVPEIEEALDRFAELIAELKQGKTMPESWSFVSGPVDYVNGFPVASMRKEDGTVCRRHVFFGGYGHFEDARKDMPLFRKLGGNIIQMEIGPWHVFPRPGKTREFEPDADYYDKVVEPALKRAWENDHRIAFLTSTHYIPGWFREKYPETSIEWNGFVPADLKQPKVLEMQREFLRFVFTRLNRSPYKKALHSVVLSNEPFYTNYLFSTSRTARPEFEKYIRKNYGSLAAFNRAAGTDYGSFSALENAAGTEPAAKREFINFKRGEMADWHKWLAEQARELLPGVPLNAKLMVNQTWAEREVQMATDPELFAEFSDINGNDNGTSCWMDPAMGTDLQFSLKPVSILNSENHFINDGEQNRVSSDLVYTSVFQQYMHGASALIGWVWADNPFEGAPWLDGCIQRRPMNIIAHQKAILDANRLAEEIVAFNLVKPEVAILYSPESLTLNRRPYCRSIFQLYSDLSTTGHKIGFLSEKQIRKGEFGNIRFLFVPDVRNIARATLPGLQRFRQRGGRIIGVGDVFLQDEYGRPLNAKIKVEKLELRQARQELRALLADTLPVQIEVRTPEKPLNVVLRRTAVLPDGRILVNAVNFDTVPHKLRIKSKTGKTAFDLISCKEFPSEFTLKPQVPLLLEFK